MHLAIEGMDGVGKTTAARALATRIGFRLIEKPLHYLLDKPGGEPDCYLRARDEINRQTDDDPLRAWFYGLGNLYVSHRFNGEHIITDRHLASNYLWCGGPETEELFRCLVTLVGSPDWTFLLRTTNDEALRRLKGRNPSDPDLPKAALQVSAARKMEAFLVRYAMPHTIIDTTTMSPDAVVDAMVDALRDGHATDT